MTGHRSWFATVVLWGVILRTGGGVAADITIRPAPETTLITEPLDDDGYVDFVAAINHEWSDGVTPENNAAVLIWTALGAEPLPETHREDFFRLLGIEPPTREKQTETDS